MNQNFTLAFKTALLFTALISNSYAAMEEECDPPVALCSNLTVYLNASGSASITAADLDNGSIAPCGLDTIILSQYNFGCADTGAVTVSLTVKDINGNTSVCNAIVNISDSTAPQLLSCPADITVNAINDNCHRNVSWIEPLFSDNCNYTLSSSHTSGQIFSVGITTVTYTATDQSGNSTQCSFNITVIDDQNPIITGCPTNLTYNLPPGKCERMIFWLGPVASDNCPGVSMTASHIPGDTLPAGTTTVTYTATDVSGNTTSCSFDITIVDKQPPQIANCPADQTVYLDGGSCNKTVSWTEPVATDNCSPLSFTSNYDSGDTLSAGVHHITYTAVDVSGNTVSCSFKITVLDTVKPVSNSQNFNAYLNAAGNITITASDLDDGSSDNCNLDTILLSKYHFTCADLGPNTIMLSSIDNSGNIHSVPAVVNVLDSIAPVVNAQNINVYLNASGLAFIDVADVNNASYDGCALDTLFLDTYTFGCNDTGNNPITLTAVDRDGNTATSQALVKVSDTISPQVLVKNVKLYLDATGSATLNLADVNNGTSDNCGIDSLYLDKYLFDCSNTGINNITLTAMDLFGNSKSAIALVEIVDTISPNALAQSATVYLNASGMATISATEIDNGSTDACGIASLSLDKSNFNCADTGNNLITLSVTDINGNISSVTANILVVDTISPLALAQDITVYLNSSGNASITPADVDAGSMDICSAVSSTLNISNFDCTDVGVNPVILTVTDAEGNSTDAMAEITVQDTISPSLSVQNLSIYLNAAGNTSISATDVNSGTSDACGLDTLILSKYDFNCTETGAHSIIFTAVDTHGNSSSGTLVVTVHDTNSPVVLTRDVDIYLDASGTASITAADIDNGSNHTCGIGQMSLSKYSYDCTDLGLNTVLLTVMDSSGNMATAPATVTVYDTISPQLNNMNITAWLSASGTVTVSPQDMDNGSYDACGIANWNLSKFTFSCADAGLNNISITIIDSSGNSSTGSVSVTIVDTISPQLITKTLNVYLDASGTATINPADIDDGSYDSCGISTMVLDKDHFNCSDIGQNNIKLTVTDNFGNSRSVTEVVNVFDTITPVINSKNPTVYLNTAGEYQLTASDISTGSSDVCGIDTLILDKYLLNCMDLGSTFINITASDYSGNNTSVAANVTVVDSIRPYLADQTIDLYLNSSGMSAISPGNFLIPAIDNCGIDTILFGKTMYTCSDLGSNFIQATVKDKSGNSYTANLIVNVMDTVKPIANAMDISVYLNAAGNVNITASDMDNSSSDDCGILSLAIDKSSFDCSDSGPNTVVLSVTDINGNTAYDTATVYILDTISPAISAHSTRYVYLDSAGQVTADPNTFDKGSTDNCSIIFSLNKSVFDCSDVGLNNQILTATDQQGNVSAKNVMIYVLDTIRPTFNNLPDTVTAYNSLGQCSAIVNWPSITASDNCSNTILGFNHLNGTFFPKGFTTVLANATDPSGNLSSRTFVVQVLDTVAPVISGLPTNFTIIANTSNCSATVSWGLVTASDNCGTAVLSSTHNPGSTFPVGTTTVTYTAVDNEGNSRSASFNVIVTDLIAPVISGVPSDIIKYADLGSCGAKVNFSTPVVTDNCSGAILSSSHNSGATFPIGDTHVNFTATDAAGNTSTAGFKITVLDNQSPEILFVPDNDTVGLCDAAYVYTSPIGKDNCGSVTVNRLNGPASGTTLSLGKTDFSFRIADNSGNDTIVSFSVWVMEGSKVQLPDPIEVCENEQIQDLNIGNSTIVWTGKGIQNGRWFDPSVAGDGMHILKYIFTDEFKCTDTGSFAVRVLPSPEIPIIAKIGSTTLSVSGNFTTYQWYRDGILIPGATSGTYQYMQAGNYQVVVGNGTSCEAFGPGFIVSSGAGGISLIEPDLTQMSIYPVPSKGYISIDLHHKAENKLEYRIFNLDGRLIHHEKTQSNTMGKINIDLTHLPVGSYLLQAITRDQSVVKNIIIQY